MNRDASPMTLVEHAVIWLAGTALALGLAAAAGASYRADDLQAEADEQDRAAISSREWAGRQVCGPRAEPQWEGDALVCLRVIDSATVARSTL